jgi:hypothetical protein
MVEDSARSSRPYGKNLSRRAKVVQAGLAVAFGQANVQLDRDIFLQTLIRELAGTLTM